MNLENVLENPEENNNDETQQQAEIAIQLNVNINGEFKDNNVLLDAFFQKLLQSINDTENNEATKIAVWSTLNGFLRANPTYHEKMHSLGVTITLFMQILKSQQSSQLSIQFIKLLHTIYAISPNKEASCSEILAPLSYLTAHYKDDLDVLRQVGDVVRILCKDNSNAMQRICLLTILDTCLITEDEILSISSLEGLELLTYSEGLHQYIVSDIIESGICCRIIDIIDRDNNKITDGDISLILKAICQKKIACQLLFDKNILPKIALMFSSEKKFVRQRGVVILRKMLYFKVGVECICELDYIKTAWEGTVDKTKTDIYRNHCIIAVCYFIQALDFNGRIEVVKEGKMKDVVKLLQEIKDKELVTLLTTSLELLHAAAQESLTYM